MRQEGKDCPKCLRTQIVDLGICSCGYIYRDAPDKTQRVRTSSTSESLDEDVQDQGIVRGEVNGLEEVTYGFIVAGMVSIFGVGAIMLLVAAGASVKDWWDGQPDRIATQQQTYQRESERSAPRQQTEPALSDTEKTLACDSLYLSIELDRSHGLPDSEIRQALVLGLREGGMTGSTSAILSQIQTMCGTTWELE